MLEETKKCKELITENKLIEAYKYWELIFDKFSITNNMTEDERYKQHDNLYTELENFTDKEVYKITDYGKRKSYLAQGIL